MVVVPVIMAPVISAHAVNGAREQGPLEPVLSTPVRHEGFLIAAAPAASVPALVIAYPGVGILLAIAALVAHPAIVSVIYAGTDVVVRLLVTSLLVGGAVRVGIAVATRTTDVHAGQRRSVLGSAPALIVIASTSLNAMTGSTALAIALRRSARL